MTQPLLDPPLEPRAGYWGRRLRAASPLVVWVVIAGPIVLLTEPPQGVPWLWLALLVSGLVVLVYAGGLMLRVGREVAASSRALRGNKRAIAALHRGDTATAQATWAALAAEPHLPPVPRTTVAHNLGVVALQSGDPDRAHAFMARVADTGWVDAFAMRRHKAGYLQGRAVVALVRGDVDEGAARMAEAHAAHQHPTPQSRAALDVAAIMLALRQDDADAAWKIAQRLDWEHVPESSRPLTAWLALRAAEGAGSAEDQRAAWDRVCAHDRTVPAWAASHWPELVADPRG